MAAADPSAIPILVKHVTMRIYAKPFTASRPPPAWVPRGRGKEQERFAIAFIMAINALTKQRYVAGGSSARPGAPIVLTGMGKAKNVKHSKDNPGATAMFDTFYHALFDEQPQREERSRGEEIMPIGQGGTRPPPSPVPPVQRRILQKKQEKEIKTLSRLAKQKTGVQRAKRAVAKAVPKMVRRKPPRGRV